MIERYQTLIMQKLWSEEEKFFTFIAIEEAYLKYFIYEKKLDENLVNIIREKIKKIDIKKFVIKIKVYEEKTQHEIIAFLYALKDELGEEAKYLHRGLTSSDILDTAFAILLKRAGQQIKNRLNELINAIWLLANKYKGLIMLGRTHGQAAEATTLGLKFLSFYQEFKRNSFRLENAILDISVGKLSGAVGVYGYTSPNIEKKVLDFLGLKVEDVSTQIIARDRHANFFSALAILAGSIERMATEIRLLSHGQINEINEPFLQHQKGSSAMPHKKNPILSENLCGLMRLIRAYAITALENQTLWHERDISHSSTERIIAPDATSLMDFAIKRLIFILENLKINQENIKENLKKEEDSLKSQSILEALIEKGLERTFAYDLIQKAFFNNKDFSSILSYLSKEELDNILNKDLMIEYEDLIFERLKN